MTTASAARPVITQTTVGRTRRTLVRGIVVRGDQRGRTLGFPTANLVLGGGDWPTDGVFAGYARRPNERVHRAAVSIGRRPTFCTTAEGVRLLEAHLLGIDEDFYGETLLVELVALLRGQARFASADLLGAQLLRDIDRCAEVLSTQPPSRAMFPGSAS